jgi:hypothetical protein
VRLTAAEHRRPGAARCSTPRIAPSLGSLIRPVRTRRSRFVSGTARLACNWICAGSGSRPATRCSCPTRAERRA